MALEIKSQASYAILHDGSAQISTLPVSNAGLTALDGAISANKVAVSSADLTTLGNCVTANELAVSNAGLDTLAGTVAASKVAISSTDLTTIVGCISASELAVSNAGIDSLAGCVSGTDLQITGSVTTTATEIAANQVFASGTPVTAPANSSSTDCRYCSKVSLMFSVDKACAFGVQVSHDATNWYDTTSALSFDGAGTSTVELDTGARYVRAQLLTGSSVACDLYVQGKQ